MAIRILAACAVAVALLAPAAAWAKVTHDSPYTYRQTFGTAVRLLEVDLDYEVTEKDDEWGYLTFHYVSRESGDRKNRASFSFVKRDGRIEVALQIPQMPSYHEQVLMQKLRHKLVDEHGEPPQPPREKEDGDDGEDERKERDEDESEPDKDEGAEE